MTTDRAKMTTPPSQANTGKAKTGKANTGKASTGKVKTAPVNTSNPAPPKADTTQPPPSSANPSPSWPDMITTFGRIGILSFGGPAAQIAIMHRELVDCRRWLREDQFLGALSFCMLLPGPEAMQLATYSGWRLRAIPGGLLAGLLFVLPGAAIILALALAYAQWGQMEQVQSAFLGIKALVVIIVLQALWKVSRKALTGLQGWIIAALSFVAIFAVNLPFPLIILAAGLWGGLMAHRLSGSAQSAIHPADPQPKTAPSRRADWQHSLRMTVIWGALWAMPLVVLAFADTPFLTELALFFAKLAIVTFGGAYAVLAYMAQAVVETHDWLTAAEMIDALGLAETTPGPLILVTQFVGHLAGYHQGGIGLAIIAGLLTLWMTFVPCFLWIFALAPHVEHILANPRLAAALKAITAAVVGVILNLSLWFAIHVFFARSHSQGAIPWPDIGSFDPVALGLTLIAGILLIGLRTGVLAALALMAGAGLLVSALV